MEKHSKSSIKIPGNNFADADSEYSYLTSLQTNANMARPYYAQICVARDKQEMKIVGAKTYSSVSCLYFERTVYEKFKKVLTSDNMNKEIATAIAFTSPLFSKTRPPILLAGYKSGLITAQSEGKTLNTLNFDETKPECFYKQPVTQFIQTPNDNEIVAVFGDSSMIKYDLRLQTSSKSFFEMVKELKNSLNFSNIYESSFSRTLVNCTQAGYFSKTSPEKSVYYATNREKSNPIAYYKFNCRTISDAVIVGHERFRKSFLKKSDEISDYILAFVNYDGFFVVFSYGKIEPQFSLKSFYGGYNSLSFSPDCAYLALAGHDDSITIVSVDNLSAVKCIGHKSFISRAIFQSIPFNTIDNSEEAKLNAFTKNSFIRVIGGGMDAQLSIFEISKEIFDDQRAQLIKSKSINLNELEDPIEIKPLVMHKFEDAVGFVEIVDNLLLICTMDGGLISYKIQHISEVVMDSVSSNLAEEEKLNEDNGKQDNFNEELKSSEEQTKKIENHTSPGNANSDKQKQDV